MNYTLKYEMFTDLSLHISRSEQNSNTCSDLSTLELLDGDNLNVQNESNIAKVNSERILSAGNADDVDSAVNLGLIIIIDSHLAIFL